jgi:hypothetical protein
MPQRDETVFVVHGLDVDARRVRADVFALKLRALIAGLRDADRFANGKVRHLYMIAALSTGSASVTIRQKQRSHKRPVSSGIATYEEAASAIYNGDRTVAHFPISLVRRIGQLSSGALRTFSHAELIFADDNIIRIDDFLERQSEVAHQALVPGPETPLDQYYRGRAIGSFDGELKEIDNRGLMLRGKLILGAGAVEIDCVMNKERVPEVREAFDKRVIIEGTAHYDGAQQLPTRIDVSNIRVVGDRGGLLRWRGAFTSSAAETEREDDWC